MRPWQVLHRKAACRLTNSKHSRIVILELKLRLGIPHFVEELPGMHKIKHCVQDSLPDTGRAMRDSFVDGRCGVGAPLKPLEGNG